jgi:hypothetical protein
MKLSMNIKPQEATSIVHFNFLAINKNNMAAILAVAT